MGQRGAAVVGRAPGDQQEQGIEIPAQGAGRVVLGLGTGRRGRDGGVRQMHGEGVRPLRAAGVEYQHAQPFGGDLGIRDAALHQPRRGRVPRPLLQAALDHQGRLVQPGGVPPQVVEDLVQFVGARVQQLQLGCQQLGQPCPEGRTQTAQGALGCLRDDGEPYDRAAREGDAQGQTQLGEGGDGGVHEQRDEVDLKADQAECGAAVAEPPGVDGTEDQEDEEHITGDDQGVQQRRQRHGGQRDGQAQRKGDRLARHLLLLDREGGDHGRHGARDHQGHVGVERRETDEGEHDRSDRPQPRHQSQ